AAARDRRAAAQACAAGGPQGGARPGREAVALLLGALRAARAAGLKPGGERLPPAARTPPHAAEREGSGVETVALPRVVVNGVVAVGRVRAGPVPIELESVGADAPVEVVVGAVADAAGQRVVAGLAEQLVLAVAAEQGVVADAAV